MARDSKFGHALLCLSCKNNFSIHDTSTRECHVPIESCVTQLSAYLFIHEVVPSAIGQRAGGLRVVLMAVEISCSRFLQRRHFERFCFKFSFRVYFIFRPSFFDTMAEGVSELYMNISSDGDCDFDEADTCQMIGVSSQARIRCMSHGYGQRPSCRGGWLER